MKKSLFFTVLLFFYSFPLHAQIQFEEHVPFAEIKQRAKKENKLIFIDCYTTWCVPCKDLAKRIFTDTTLGNRYNELFINFKLDTEKGEGPELAKAFKINAFPTLLWVDSTGDIVHRTVGTNTVEFFLNTIELVQDENNRYFLLEKRFQDGDRDPALLKKLTRFAAITKDLKGRPYIEAYFESIPESEWLSAENQSFFYAGCTSFDAKLMRYVLANTDKFEHDTIENLKTSCFDIANRFLIRSRSEEELKKFLALVDTYAPERQEYRKASELDFYMNVGNWVKLNELTSRYLKDWNDAYILSVYSWERSVREKDPELLKEAIDWAKRAIKLEEDDWNCDTLGQLYLKTGKPKKAEKWLKRSKELENL
ncbi:thioredoxin family protein [Fluviicola sp.]|uniref:thioredoxin family protein n=1 Tax=Fluviicola sp. TaxID=1917219 RepID=UPI0031D0AF01